MPACCAARVQKYSFAASSGYSRGSKDLTIWVAARCDRRGGTRPSRTSTLGWMPEIPECSAYRRSKSANKSSAPAYVVLKPSSRGTVKLRGSRPDAKPRIFNNFLATEEDRRSMIRGVQLTMDVAQRPALAAVCRAPHLVPASSSDADVWSFIERR